MSARTVLPALSRIRYALLLSLLALLGACTGTEELRLPTLLAVGLSQNGEPQVALVRTVLESEGEYTLLDASRRELAASAVAFDVTERSGGRDTLVVLSGDETEAYLDFFTLRGVDPDAPTAFAPARARLTLSALEDAADSVCPSSVQTSRTGRYVAVFHSTDCGADEAAIDIIDVDEASVLERISGGTFGLVEADPYLDQQSDRLYYLTQDVSDANLVELRLPSLASEEITTLDDQDQVDISEQGTNLLVLNPSDIVIVPLAEPDETLTLDTSSGARRFIDNLSPTRTELLILGNERLSVHTSLEDSDEQSVGIDTAYGTLDAAESFAYFSSDEAVLRFDLLRYAGDFSGLVRSFSVAGLNDPGPITHFKGILPNEPQP